MSAAKECISGVRHDSIEPKSAADAHSRAIRGLGSLPGGYCSQAGECSAGNAALSGAYAPGRSASRRIDTVKLYLHYDIALTWHEAQEKDGLLEVSYMPIGAPTRPSRSCESLGAVYLHLHKSA